MAKQDGAGFGSSGVMSGQMYMGSIPDSAFKAGDMVRWYFEAVDESGSIFRAPLAADAGEAQYYGTVVDDSNTGNASVPMMQW